MKEFQRLPPPLRLHKLTTVKLAAAVLQPRRHSVAGGRMTQFDRGGGVILKIFHNVLA